MLLECFFRAGQRINAASMMLRAGSKDEKHGMLVTTFVEGLRTRIGAKTALRPSALMIGRMMLAAQ